MIIPWFNFSEMLAWVNILFEMAIYFCHSKYQTICTFFCNSWCNGCNIFSRMIRKDVQLLAHREIFVLQILTPIVFCLYLNIDSRKVYDVTQI